MPCGAGAQHSQVQEAGGSQGALGQLKDICTVAVEQGPVVTAPGPCSTAQSCVVQLTEFVVQLKGLRAAQMAPDKGAWIASGSRPSCDRESCLIGHSNFERCAPR
jgi:hypothetical protein